MSAGIEVKVEDYDGTYACAFCSESVRGQPALKCSRCSSNPVHRVCADGTMYERQCATCMGETMEVWRGASAGTAVPSEIIDLRDLEAEAAGAAEVDMLTQHAAREDAVPAVGGGVVAADVARRESPGGRADAGSGSRGKGKEPAWAEAGPEAGGDGAATSAGADAVGGGGKGKRLADNDSVRARLGDSGKESSGEGSGGGRSGHSGGSVGSRAAKEQRGEGSSKRAAPDGDDGGGSGGGKRARGG